MASKELATPRVSNDGHFNSFSFAVEFMVSSHHMVAKIKATILCLAINSREGLP